MFMPLLAGKLMNEIPGEFNVVCFASVEETKSGSKYNADFTLRFTPAMNYLARVHGEPTQERLSKPLVNATMQHFWDIYKG
jgi:hypothetical protein